MGSFLSIVVGTLILEDVALAYGLALAAQGKISAASAFAACAIGIAVGDIGLYILGRVVARSGLENRFKFVGKWRRRWSQNTNSSLLTYSILVCRFVPGTRLPTYIASGFFGYSFWKFAIFTILTVLAWVALAFAFGSSILRYFTDHWILGFAVLVLGIHVLKSFVPIFLDKWKRRAWQQSWRQYLSFEFWPAAIFYLPLIPIYLYLATKYRSLLAPFYANPGIENGGLIGESKWDFLCHLDAQSPHTLAAFCIDAPHDLIETRRQLDREGLSYPLILKPDIGQRGFGVRIVRDDFDLTEYLLAADFKIIAQRLSEFPHEAGVFYVRHPRAPTGRIFSITDKRFPSIKGDGVTALGQLILRDRRARIIAATYFERHRDRLDSIPAAGETVALSECGNHCQGAIFLDGRELKTAELEKTIHEIAEKIPNFYFGRFDVRYRDRESFMRGENFEIVEVNGAGSEATHIWDERTKLVDAYRVLFRQWALLFEIGATVKRDLRIKPKIRFKRFLSESFRVYLRREELSISS